MASILSGTMAVLLAVFSLTSATTSTYMGIFDIPFSVTMVDTSASAASSNPPSQETIYSIAANLTGHLYEVYGKTTGFVTVSAPTLQSYSATNVVLTYSVVYNKTTLNDDGQLTANNSAFIKELTRVAAVFGSTSYALDGFSVAGSATEQAMLKTINDVVDAFNSTQWICSGLVCSTSSTCYQNTTTNIVACVNKCLLFTVDNTKCTANPTISGAYVVGTCAYDQYYQPYCDCGMSVGNILYNLYDGTQCVSATFITAFSAGCGGVLLIMCIILIVIINNQREAMLKVYETERRLKLAEAAAVGNFNPTFTGVIEDKVAMSSYDYQDPTISTLTSADVYRGEVRLATFQPPLQELAEVKISDEAETISEQF